MKTVSAIKEQLYSAKRFREKPCNTKLEELENIRLLGWEQALEWVLESEVKE